jgi:hypothetical protein
MAAIRGRTRVACESRSCAPSLLACTGLLAAPAGAEPLDLEDATPRTIQVEMQGVVVSAGYAVQAGAGVVSISAESHQQLRPHFLEPVPESFTPLTLTIDLADGSGTSSLASGGYESYPLSESFTQGPLSTETVAGYMQGNSLPPLYCASQQQIDEACLLQPIFCGVVCVPVAGSRFDPDTGEVALVGGEERLGCDGGLCFGPYVYLGLLDPVLSELAAPVPSLGSVGRVALPLALLLLAAARAAATRRTA